MFVFMDVPKLGIEKRLEKRVGHYFKQNLLQSQFDALEPPEDDEDRVVTINGEKSFDFVAESVQQIWKNKFMLWHILRTNLYVKQSSKCPFLFNQKLYTF